MRLTFTVSLELSDQQAETYLNEYGVDDDKLRTDLFSNLANTLHGSPLAEFASISVRHNMPADPPVYTWVTNGEPYFGTLADYGRQWRDARVPSADGYGADVSGFVCCDGRRIPVETRKASTDDGWTLYNLLADGDVTAVSVNSRG